MIRTLDGAFLTEVANHPEVRPWLGGKGWLDLRETIANPANITLQGLGGGFVMISLDPCRYEIHSLFLPGSRGAPEAARTGLQFMFIQTDCLELVTKVPAPNVRAHGLTRWMGFSEVFRLPVPWEGDEVDCSFRRLDIDTWGLRALGGDAEKLLRLMLDAGNGDKAIWCYNRWARFAGRPLMEG